MTHSKTPEVLLVFADPVLYPAVQPYGLMILAEQLRHAGISCEVICPYFHENPADVLKKSCEQYRPKIVAFSFRNLDTAGFHYSEDADEIYLDGLRELVVIANVAGPLSVIGGSGFSIAPQQILDFTGADFGFVGPSESDFAEFCLRVVRQNRIGEALSVNLRSIIRRGCTIAKPSEQSLGNSLRFNSTALEFARIAGGTIPIRTKVGCSLTCSYCVVPSIEFSAYRPWADICRELRSIVNAGLAHRVFVADGEFNLPSIDRATQLCKKIEGEFGDSIKWRCYLEGGYITEELLGAMASSGCIGISLTVDSFCKETRIGMIKRTPPEAVIQATELCLASAIHTQINLLFGGPNETRETADRSATSALEFNQSGVAVAVTIGLRVYPNTPLALMVKREKYFPFFAKSRRFEWLGMFCSPIPRRELTEHVQRILVPSNTIVYTQSPSGSERTFYERIAAGSTCLTEGRFKAATEYFQLSGTERMRPEARLGLLKAKLGEISESEDPSSRI